MELNRKTVQHQEGGIVRELLVRDGQKVRAGDALMVVADLRSDADLAVLQDRRRAVRARIARAAPGSGRCKAAQSLRAEPGCRGRLVQSIQSHGLEISLAIKRRHRER